MGDFEDKLQSVLSSPDAMEQVMAMARGLMGGDGAPSSDASAGDTEPQAAPASAAPDLSSLFSGLDPGIVSTAMNVFGEYNKDDHNIRLLHAIKPHLSSERHERVDHAVQILRLSKAVRQVMRGTGGGASFV